MFKWLRKNERGSIMVIVALSLAVLLGFTGFAVDFGTLALAKQELQNAADAAALAGGQDKVMGYGTGTITATANNYITANGINLGDGVTFSQVLVNGNQVTVTITTQKACPFTSVLTGQKTRSVSATAVVEVMTEFNNFPYALFAGKEVTDQNTLYTNASGTVNGNIHSNSNISMNSVTVNGAVTAVGDINYKGHSSDGTSPVIPMPSYADLEAKALAGYRVNGNVKLKKKDGENLKHYVDEAIKQQNPSAGETVYLYFNGNITGQGGELFTRNFGYPVTIFCTGDIDFGGTEITSTADCPVTIVALGDITVNGVGTGEAFYGIIFAPLGDVQFNGNYYNIHGSVYGQTIDKRGNQFNVSYNAFVDDQMPKGKVRLVG